MFPNQESVVCRCFKMKFGTYTKSNMYKMMQIFNFFDGNAYLSCFGSEIPYLGKFGLKSKLVKMKVGCLDQLEI